MKETFSQPAGPGLEATVPLARWKQLEQSLVGVAINYTGFTEALSVVIVLDGGSSHPLMCWAACTTLHSALQ